MIASHAPRIGKNDKVGSDAPNAASGSHLDFKDRRLSPLLLHRTNFVHYSIYLLHWTPKKISLCIFNISFTCLFILLIVNNSKINFVGHIW